MEKSTAIGIVSGVLAVGVGMVMKGASLSSLNNPAAFLIIIVGTMACIFNAFPMEEVKKAPVLFKMLFRQPPHFPEDQLLKLFIELSQTARREGILALESRVAEIPNEFLRSGLAMVIDGLDPDFVGDVLDAEVKAMEERHRNGALIFSQAGSYAPTLGVLGAVVGLVAALGNLNDIDKLGHSIAAAFIATLVGIFTGYVLWNPFSNKLKVMSKAEAENKKMMIEGILSLQAGDSPTAIEAKLMVFIPNQQRALMKPKTEEK